MSELERIVREISKTPGLSFRYYAEKTHPTDMPVCDKQFEGITDDGQYTYFRFFYRNVGYIGVLEGVEAEQKNYARLLPSYIESFADKETELSKTEHLKRILLGECSTMGIYKYGMKFSVKGTACFAIVLRVPRLMAETLALLEQYGGNSLDTTVQMGEDTCVLVKFLEEMEEKIRLAAEAAKPVPEPEHEAEIGIEAFSAVELRVAEILACEPVPKAKKLLKLQVDLGYEKRQVVSGIAKFYKPEDLIGKKVCLVTNLKPCKLCGVDSFGMILASGEEDVKVVFLDPSAKNGDRIH